MAEEDEIEGLIGRMPGAQRQGFHLTPSAMRLVLTALRFYLAARSWLAQPRDQHDDGPPPKPREEHTGSLPTIGSTKGLGIAACHIQCAGPDCWNT